MLSIPFQRRLADFPKMVGAAVLFFTSAAYATPVISTTTRAGTSNGATGTAITDCRPPCPVVVDAGSGTTSSHQTGSAEQLGIRFGEVALTGSARCDYTHGTLTLSCPNNAFTTFSNEVTSISTFGGGNWTTAGAGDALAFYHDGVAGVRNKPKGVRIANSDATEGTCGSLSDGQWCWGDVNTIGANRVYVQLTAPATDPDLETSGHVEIIYGDGEYIQLQHADWNSGNPVYVYVDYKSNESDIVLMEAPSGASGNITDNTVTVYQSVNSWNDLRYEWSTSCVGHSTCVAPITNTDTIRPGDTATSVNMSTFTGPAYPLVLGDVNTDGTISEFGTATVTLNVYDDANGGTDSQTITIDDLTTSYEKEIYLDYTLGTDHANCLTSLRASDCTLVAPCKTWECGWSQLWRHATASDSIRVYLKRGETFVVATAPGADYSNKTNASRNVLIAPYGTGADPIIQQGGGAATFRFSQASGTASHNIRVVDISISKTTGTANIFTFSATKSLLMRTTIDVLDSGSGLTAVERGGSNVDNYDDSIYWDNRWTMAKDLYVVYDSQDTTWTNFLGKRVAYVGNYMYLEGNAAGGATMRTNVAGPQVLAYNYFLTTATASSSPVLRLMYADGVYSYRDWMVAGVDNSGCMNNGCGLACGSGTSTDWLVDGAYCDQTNSNQGIAAFVFIEEKATGDSSAQRAGNLLVRNSIIKGGERGFNCTSTAAPDLRVFHNTFYSTATEANGIPFISSTGNGSFPNWKAINNIAVVTQNDSDNDAFVTTGNFDYLGGVQILRNVWSQGSSTGDFGSIVGVSYSNDAAWMAASNKSAQDNDETNPILANPSSNDFRLCTASGVPDASCSGASPCIDAGYDLPTVWYAYDGSTRSQTASEDDVGAYDETYLESATGACCVGLTCTATTEAACTGTYKGDDTTCSPNPCLGKNRGIFDKMFRPFGGMFGYGYDDTGFPCGE